MENNVLILTEAGREFGYGHLMRCLAIAQGFRAKGIDSVFYLRGDSKPEKILSGFIWHNVDWMLEDINYSLKIVIVDSYYANEDFCSKVYKEAKVVLFIDDYNRITYPGGFVLNSVIGADKIGYPEKNDIIYLLGPEFHPLRKEFWNVPAKKIRERVEKVLITFGGTDMTNETPGVLLKLKELYPELEKHVIIGNGFTNIDEIKNASDKKTLLISHPDAEKMKQEMLECDIAISAAGQTIYELARVGITTFAKKIVENQDNIIKNWKAVEFLKDVDSLCEIPDYIDRNIICNKGRRIVDGKGVIRIVEKLLNDNR